MKTNIVLFFLGLLLTVGFTSSNMQQEKTSPIEIASLDSVMLKILQQDTSISRRRSCVPRGGDCTFMACCPGAKCRDHGEGEKSCR